MKGVIRMGGALFGFLAALLGGTAFGVINWTLIVEFFKNLF